MKFLKISVTYFVTLFFYQELRSHVIQGNDQFSLQQNFKNKRTANGPNKAQDKIRLRLNLNNAVKERLKPKVIVNPPNLAVKHRIGKTPSNNRNDKGKTKSKPKIAVDIQLPMLIRNTKMPTNNVQQTNKGFDIIDAPAKEFYVEDANILCNIESQIEKPISKSQPQETQSKPLLIEEKDFKQRKANNKTDFVPKISTKLKELDLKSNTKGENCSLVPDKVDNKFPIIKLTKDVVIPHYDSKTNIVTDQQLTSNKTHNEIPIIKLNTENKSVDETKKDSELTISDESPQNKSHTLCEKDITPIEEDKQMFKNIPPISTFITTKINRIDNGTVDVICIKQHNYTEVTERHSGNPSNKLHTSDHKNDCNTPSVSYYPFQHYDEIIKNITHGDPFKPDFTYIQPSYEFPNVDKINAKNWEIKSTATHEKSKSTIDDDNPITTVKSWYNSEVTIKTSRDNTPAIVEMAPHIINTATKDDTHYYKPTYYEEDITTNYRPTSYKEDINNHYNPISHKDDVTNHYHPTSYKEGVTNHYKPISYKEDVTNHYRPTFYKEDVNNHYVPTSYKEDVSNHYKPTSYKDDVTNHYNPTSYKDDVGNNYNHTSYTDDDINHYKPISYKEDATNHYKPISCKEDVTNHNKPTSYKEDVGNHYKHTSYKDDFTNHYKPNSYKEDVNNHYKPTSYKEYVSDYHKPTRNDKVVPVNYAHNNNHNALYGHSGTHNNNINHHVNIPEPPSCSYYPCYLYPTYNYPPYGQYI